MKKFVFIILIYIFKGKGIEKNLEEAMNLFIRSSELGDATAKEILKTKSFV
jgi:TPR repeat protein